MTTSSPPCATKKNVVLQGPPGVGKTFIAKRIAYTLLEGKDDSKIAMVQFHQSYAYEDFVQGIRPTRGGGFEVKRGVFYEFCDTAKLHPDKPFFFIIDEINRGNLSKIFGELLMLLEADKRGEGYAIPLTYSESGEEKFFVPANVYLIGTMNTADRSIAMVDYALRRRFRFIDLEPEFNGNFKEQLAQKFGAGFCTALISRINSVNQYIAGDRNLGKGFMIGHSYFSNLTWEEDGESWLANIVRTEIGPLLREYWFDDEATAEKLTQTLLQL